MDFMEKGLHVDDDGYLYRACLGCAYFVCTSSLITYEMWSALPSRQLLLIVDIHFCFGHVTYLLSTCTSFLSFFFYVQLFIFMYASIIALPTFNHVLLFIHLTNLNAVHAFVQSPHFVCKAVDLAARELLSVATPGQGGCFTQPCGHV